MTTRREITEKEEEEGTRDLVEKVMSIVRNVNTNPNTLRKTQFKRKRKKITTALTPNPKFVPSESKKSDNLKMMVSLSSESQSLKLVTQKSKDRPTTNNMVKNTTTHHKHKTNDQIKIN
jgi:hypothetical protein